MSIQEVGQRIKGALSDERVTLGGLLCAVALCSFTLGRASVASREDDTPLVPTVPTQLAAVAQSDKGGDTRELAKISGESNEGATTTSENRGVSAPVASTYVASKKGTKYHLPWCSGAKAISEENKIWFATIEEAVRAGYEPAKNCKGL